MFALLVAFEIVSATAAATLIGPLLVEALGVLAPPVPSPPFAAAVLSAWPRSPATWPSTPPAGAPPEPSLGAPAADAVAEDEAVERSIAVKVTAPPAVMFRSVVAVAVWFANVSAIAAPTAADPPVVSPDAVVFAVAVVVRGERGCAGRRVRRTRLRLRGAGDVADREGDRGGDRDAAARGAGLRFGRHGVRVRRAEREVVAARDGGADADLGGGVRGDEVQRDRRAEAEGRSAATATRARQRLRGGGGRRCRGERDVARARIRERARADRRGRGDLPDDERERAGDADRSTARAGRGLRGDVGARPARPR